jgi:site-specific recombinase
MALQVDGGGIVVLLLRSVKSLQQLYTMAMDVHARFRTEAHSEVVCRFNERFLLSLQGMQNCQWLFFCLFYHERDVPCALTLPPTLFARLLLCCVAGYVDL